jgi:hypothetical protein
MLQSFQGNPWWVKSRDKLIMLKNLPSMLVYTSLFLICSTNAPTILKLRSLNVTLSQQKTSLLEVDCFIYPSIRMVVGMFTDIGPLPYEVWRYDIGNLLSFCCNSSNFPKESTNSAHIMLNAYYHKPMYGQTMNGISCLRKLWLGYSSTLLCQGNTKHVHTHMYSITTVLVYYSRFCVPIMLD